LVTVESVPVEVGTGIDVVPLRDVLLLVESVPVEVGAGMEPVPLREALLLIVVFGVSVVADCIWLVNSLRLLDSCSRSWVLSWLRI